MPRPRTIPFWDRNCDSEGKPIRVDVRQAAQEIWDKVVRTTESVLGDYQEAAEILEICVARVSRYMDERGHGPFTQRTEALLFVAFRNALRSQAQKRRRLQSIGDAKLLDSHRTNSTWHKEIEVRLDVRKLVRALSPRSRLVLRLRSAGYNWVEVAGALGVPTANAKGEFWKEIKGLRSKTAAGPRVGEVRQQMPSRIKPPQGSSAIASPEDQSNSATEVALCLTFRSPPKQTLEKAA